MDCVELLNQSESLSSNNTVFFIGAASAEDCTACTGGYYCQNEGQNEPTGLCAPGYYCLSNYTATDPQPNGYLCPAGKIEFHSQNINGLGD